MGSVHTRKGILDAAMPASKVLKIEGGIADSGTFHPARVAGPSPSG
jgi:hypothetical protein